MKRHSSCERLLSLALALCLLFSGTIWPTPARAHDAEFGGGVSVGPDDADEDPERGCNDDTADPSGGTNPVLLDTGEYALRSGQLTTPEPVLRVRGELVLDLRRSYRSGWNYNGPLGPGWDQRFNRRLRLLRDSNILLTWGNCRRDRFTWNGTGWDAPPGVFTTLVQNADGTMTHTFPNGVTHKFDRHGNLVEIRDRHNNRVRLQYTGERMLIAGRSRFFTDVDNRVITREYRLESILDPTDRKVQLSYDATTGRLTAIKDWTGRTWSYDHDLWGNLTTVTGPPTTAHPKGPKTTYEYKDPRFPHHITAVIPPNGQPTGEGVAAVARVTNVYDESGRVSTQRFGSGGTSKIAYNATDTTVTDPNGTQWIYHTADRQITGHTVVTRGVRATAKEATGTRYTTRTTYSSDKRRTRIVFPAGNAIERVFDSANKNVLARGNLLTLRQVPPTGSTDPVLETRFTYKTPYQQLGTITDPRGHVTEFFYDATTHNLLRIELPAAAPAAPAAPATPTGTAATPPPTPATGGAPTGDTAPAATAPPRPTVHAQIDSHGQLTQLTDPNGQILRLQYDSHGYLSQVTRAHGTPLAATTTFTRDALGRATAIRDANGHTTSFQYNAWDLVTRRTAPTPLGYVTHYHYDLSGNLARTERQSGDAEDPQTTTYTYNVRNWLLSASNELGHTTRYSYDSNGNLRTRTDPAGRITTWTFDERNQLYETRDALGQTTRLFYTSNGLLSEVVDAKNQSTRYSYDSHDRIRTTTHADASTERRAYDKANNLISWTTRAGQTLTFTYDTQDRRITKVTPAGTTRTRYDLGGRMSRVASPGATLTYAYNARDQLVTETTQPAGRTAAWTVSREYDGENNLKKLTYPDGSAYHYNYDSLNRLQAVQNAAKQNLVSYSFDSLHRRTRSDRQSGVRSDYVFDEANRPTSIVHKQSATATSSLLSLAYSWDTASQITSLTDDLGKTGISYDTIYRLTGAAAPTTAPYPDQTFAYDAAGNRSSVVATPQTPPATTPPPPPPPTPAPTPAPAGGAGSAGSAAAPAAGADAEEDASADPPAAPATPAPTTPPAPTPTPTPAASAATTTAYTANNLNQYTRVGTATYAYDKNGNLTSDGTRIYSWDAENRLTGATIPGAAGAAATTASYSYDEYHRRVKKTVGTTTTYFLWSGDTLLAEYSGTGTLKRRYLYAGDFAPAQVHDIADTTTAVYDVHTDHLDTPRLLTNSTGAAVWTSHHEPFGKAHIASDPDGDGTHLAFPFPFRFPGQYEDEETGLHYNRYYDPHIGRYLSPDPLGQIDGPNLYSYAANDPLNFLDPYGLTYSWQDFKRDARYAAYNAAQGLAAAIDGAIPVFDPFAAAGAYNPCDPALQPSRIVGAITAGALAALYGYGLANGFGRLTGIGAVEAAASGVTGGVEGGANVAPPTSRRPSNAQRDRQFEQSKDADGVPRCYYCGGEITREYGQPNSYETDHKTPYSRGGPTTDENLAPSCRTCNRRKGARTAEEFRDQ